MTACEPSRLKCAEFGWVPEGDVDPNQRAEFAHYARCGVGRAWSSCGTYALRHPPAHVYLVYVAEGAIDLTVDGQRVTASPGQLVLLGGPVPLIVRVTTLTARYMWFFEPSFVGAGLSQFVFNAPVTTSSGSLRALLSLTNSLLKAPSEPAGNAQAHIEFALEHLAAAALDEAGALPTGSEAANRDRLYAAALSVIESYFRDPTFNAARIATALGVSARSVYAAFSSYGTTPRRQIELRRLTEIDRMPGRFLTTADRIERAGFTSVRQYHRALARSRTPSSLLLGGRDF